MPVTHWIYPTNKESGYTSDPDGDTQVSPQNLLDEIQQTRDSVDRWLLGTGFRQMRPGDTIWFYASNPHQCIYALAQVVDVDHDDEGWHVSLVWDLAATELLISDPIPRSMFGQVARTAAVRANQPTAKVLDEWLTTKRTMLASLGAEPVPGEDLRRRVVREIVQRQGQHAFRHGLLNAYNRRCAVTGDGVVDVLDAAHIDPYMGPHTNRLDNGLLLRTDLHTLFDLHLIGVDREGKLVVSDALADSTYAKLHGKHLRLPRRTQDHPSKRRLAAHLRLLLSG